ncbi:hypothetical protein VP01_6838g1, partial [Puccinia sorghi]
PHQVKCLTNFTLYITNKKKSKSKNKVWVPVIPDKPFLISLIASPASKATDFAIFQKENISQCKLAVTNAGVKIQEALETGSPKIKWAVTIPRVPGFQSKSPHILNNKDEFAFWIKTLADLGCLDAGLTLSMVNPKKAEARARQAGLLAKERLRADSAKEAVAARLLDPDANSNDPPDNEDEMDLDALELFMRQIYKKNPCNVLYDQHLPVYISPGNPQKFILITNAACTAWAKDLVSFRKTWHFSHLSAQHSSLSYKALTSYFNDHQAASSITGCQIQQHLGYIKFIGLRNPKAVLEILESNDMLSYKIFKSCNLGRSVVLSIGLTVGVVTQLYDYVSKYERHLAKTKIAANASMSNGP